MKTIKAQVIVSLTIESEDDEADFIGILQDMDYNFKSLTPQATITETEILQWDLDYRTQETK